MPYVMVPVPEEHVEDVMQFILRAIARASIVPWDEASLGETYHEVDETTRSLLAFVARAEAEGKELDSGTAARQIQMTPREVNGILNELQTMTRDANRPPLVVVRVAPQRLAERPHRPRSAWSRWSRRSPTSSAPSSGPSWRRRRRAWIRCGSGARWPPGRRRGSADDWDEPDATGRAVPPSIEVDHVSASYHIRIDTDSMLDDVRRLFRRGDSGGRLIPALRDVSFDVRKGSVLAVIGRNGAGKSTLCRVILGTLPPEEGRVVVRGRINLLAPGHRLQRRRSPAGRTSCSAGWPAGSRRSGSPRSPTRSASSPSSPRTSTSRCTRTRRGCGCGWRRRSRCSSTRRSS